MTVDIPNPIIRRIGKILLMFNIVEAIYKAILQQIISSDIEELTTIITSQMDFPRIKRTVLLVYEKQYGKDVLYEELKGLDSISNELYTVRNKLVHSTYTASSEGATRHASKATNNQELRIDTEVIEVKTLDNTIKELESFSDKLMLAQIHVIMKRDNVSFE